MIRDNATDVYGKVGNMARFLMGTFVVALVGFTGLVIAPGLGLTSFWPFAGVWAALGWAASRISLKSTLMLTLLGLFMDLLSDAPLGCWPAILLVAYFSASVFRNRAQTDRTGAVRLIGDLTSLLLAFGAARWIMGAYLGEMATQAILGGFLVTALLYLPVRPVFLLRRGDWVDT